MSDRPAWAYSPDEFYLVLEDARRTLPPSDPRRRELEAENRRKRRQTLRALRACAIRQGILISSGKVRLVARRHTPLSTRSGRWTGDANPSAS